ncbi:MAG TPA: nitroreductase [Candidatus Caccomorpha excrementavium]|nr:nitroreductase [Candidatus Caccomorpha excrementavium]
MKETLQDLKTRRSVRSYQKKQISDEQLNAILEAGTWAPTGMGAQSPVIVVIQNPELIARLSRLNAEVMGNPGSDPFYGAPTLLVVLADSTRRTYVEDGSLVMGNLLNAAHAVGVDSCWIHRAREVFSLPEGKALLKEWGLGEQYEGIGNCILGYAAGEIPAPKPRKQNYIIRV